MKIERISFKKEEEERRLKESNEVNKEERGKEV